MGCSDVPVHCNIWCDVVMCQYTETSGVMYQYTETSGVMYQYTATTTTSDLFLVFWKSLYLGSKAFVVCFS